MHFEHLHNKSKKKTSTFFHTHIVHPNYYPSSLGESIIELGGAEMAQSLASLSVNRAVQVCARLDPLVTER